MYAVIHENGNPECTTHRWHDDVTGEAISGHMPGLPHPRPTGRLWSYYCPEHFDALRRAGRLGPTYDEVRRVAHEECGECQRVGEEAWERQIGRRGPL